MPFDYTQLPMKLVGLASKILTSKLDTTQIPTFPKYPSDNSADILHTILKNDTNAKPLIWPEKKKYCVVFTHDVDTSWIFDNSEGRKWYNQYTDAEESFGIRSSWYCVPVSLKSSNTKNKLKELHLHCPGLK